MCAGRMRHCANCWRVGWLLWLSTLMVSRASTPCREPGECVLGGGTVLCRRLGESCDDDGGVDELGVKQRRYEISVFLAEGAQFGDA